MGVKLDVGSNRFPAVISVDANKREDAVNLIFNTRIEGPLSELRSRFPNGKISNSS
jgi:hypothetical protein